MIPIIARDVGRGASRAAAAASVRTTEDCLNQWLQRGRRHVAELLDEAADRLAVPARIVRIERDVFGALEELLAHGDAAFPRARDPRTHVLGRDDRIRAAVEEEVRATGLLGEHDLFRREHRAHRPRRDDLVRDERRVEHRRHERDALAEAETAALDAGESFTAVDAAAVALRVRPLFTSITPGHPAYGQLARSIAEELFTGAEDGSEMGAFHMLQQAHRESNLRVALEQYLRFGLDAGIFHAT